MNELSVIVVARHVSERLLGLVHTVRPVAEELVVAVDDRGGDGGLGALEEIADVVVTFPFLDVIERSWGWIASIAGSPWALWLDDDVVPSPAFLSALPSLVTAEDVTHYHLRHAWLWPDAEHILDEPPWRNDLHPRLFRCDPATVWFPGIVHAPIKALGPSRYVDRALLHLDLLVNPIDRRRAKVASYEARHPGLRVAGRPINEAYYLPEDRRPPPRVAVLPPEDRSAVESTLALSDARLETGSPRASVRRATREEVDASFHGWALDERVDEGVVEIVDSVAEMRAGVHDLVETRVTNGGGRTWPPNGFDVSDVRLSYRWYLPDGALVVDGGLRTAMPVAVVPGATEVVFVSVIAPERPGPYILGVDLVRENVAWFGVEARREINVLPQPVVGVVLDPTDEELALDVAATVVDQLPWARPILLARDPGPVTLRHGYEADDDPAAALFAGGLRSALTDLATILRRPSVLAERRLDVVVLAGGRALTGGAGRREKLRLAGALRAFERLGTPIVLVERTPVATSGVVGTLVPAIERVPAGDRDVMAQVLLTHCPEPIGDQRTATLAP